MNDHGRAITMRRNGRSLRTSAISLVSLLAVMMAWASAQGAEAFPKWTPPGKNIALGKSYTFAGAPKFSLTTDDGDATQLTDGKYVVSTNFIWFEKDALGWDRQKPLRTAGFTVDLGEVRSIAGLSYSTDAGQHAAVGYPPAILVFVSDDGKAFHVAGELVGLSAKFGPPPEWGRFRFVTDELNTRGRYVQVLFQTAQIGVCDEVEIYEGKPDTQAPAGPVIEDPRKYAQDHAVGWAIAARVATDAARARAIIAALGLKEAAVKPILAALEQARLAAQTPDPEPADLSRYRALIPLNATHARIFELMAEAHRAAGHQPFEAWPVARWARQSPFTALAGGTNAVGGALTARLMQNERRGETFNLANFSPKATTALVTFSGLPGGAKPAYMDVRQAEYVTLQARSSWDADALPKAEATDKGWKVSLPAGVVRQVWLDFRTDKGDCPAGEHQGQVEIQVAGGPKLSLPLTLKVEPFKMASPRDRAVAVGCWDGSTLGKGGFGMVGTGNVAAAVAHMRDSGLNAPWAYAGSGGAIIPQPRYVVNGLFDESGKLVREPKYEELDQWLATWPDAKLYMIYAGAYGGFDVNPDPEKLAKKELDEDQRKFGEVLKVWAAHIRKQGVDPSRIVICLLDEPGYANASRTILYWAQAIRAAVPEIKLFEDPVFRPDTYSNYPVFEMLAAMDYVTPAPDWSYHRRGQVAYDFYEKVRQAGANIGFYTCSQGVGGTEATKYYRLQQWECWMANKGGANTYAGFWSYGDNRGNWPWAQIVGGGSMNFVPAYLDADSATDGKHWVAIFEGAQDYEYLLMLKQRIEALRKEGRNDAAVEAAQKLLDTLPGEVIAAVKNGEPALHTGEIALPWNSGDMNACDPARLKVLDALASLAEPAGKP